MADPTARDVLVALASFARNRWGYRFRSRDALLSWQRKRVRIFLRETLARASFYGRPARDLSELPIIDTAVQYENFDGLNTVGLTLERALAVATAAENSAEFDPVFDGAVVGIAVGSGGARRPFLLSQRERLVWTGCLIARVLSTASLAQALTPWRRPLRIALVGAWGSRVFHALPLRRIRFEQLDPKKSLGDQVGQLNSAPPDIIVAPPSALLRLADASTRGLLRIAPRQIVSIAEMLDTVDAQRVREAFGAEVRHVHQSTDGLLAYSCPHGTLHLNETELRVEKQWLDDEHIRFVPVVTAFARETQLIVRLRLDNILRVALTDCDCSEHSLALAGVDGRTDAVLHAPRAGGNPLSGGRRHIASVFPDQIEQVMSPPRARGLFEEWRIVQHADGLVVSLLAPRPGATQAIERELTELFQRSGANPPSIRFGDWRSEEHGVRMRRIRTA